jgi:hypothetical protein
MERHIAAGRTEAEARAIVEEAMRPFPVWPAHLGGNEHSQQDIGKGLPGIAA